jgi:hypothetical protein
VKVAWVQDISRPHGGAENSNRTVVAAGEKIGHDIVGLTPENFNPAVLSHADVLVVNNFWQFPKEIAAMIHEAMWEKGKPYVVYSHDYRDLLNRKEMAKKMFGRSRLNVFISPRHHDDYCAGLGCEGITLPLAIDVDLFRPVDGVYRDPEAILVVGGWLRGGKFSRRLVDFSKGKKVVSVGIQFDGARVIPHRPLEKMPEIYSSVSALAHFPDIDCAGERVVFEAALCGVKQFQLGERVGHASWGFDLQDVPALKETLREAPKAFWRAVEERCAR